MPSLAIDLPGRGDRPRALDSIAIADFVEAVIDDLKSFVGVNVVLVGHSMAGLTIPGVLERASERIAHVVFVSCTIPADGASLQSLFSPDLLDMIKSLPPGTEGARLSPEQVRITQTYDMDEAQTKFTTDIVVAEAVGPPQEAIDLTGLQNSRVPRTWVNLLGDRSFPPDLQRTMADRAGCTDIVPLDSGHMAMISHPAELAAILNPIHAEYC